MLAAELANRTGENVEIKIALFGRSVSLKRFVSGLMLGQIDFFFCLDESL